MRSKSTCKTELFYNVQYFFVCDNKNWAENHTIAKLC